MKITKLSGIRPVKPLLDSAKGGPLLVGHCRYGNVCLANRVLNRRVGLILGGLYSEI